MTKEQQRCPDCGAQLQRFTFWLHCPACNKNVARTSTQCGSFVDDPDAPGCCLGCGDAKEAHVSSKQQLLSALLTAVETFRKYPPSSMTDGAVRTAWDAYASAPDETADRQPIAWVPVHPKNGPLWSNVIASKDADRPAHYPLMPLYSMPSEEPKPERLYNLGKLIVDTARGTTPEKASDADLDTTHELAGVHKNGDPL